MLLNLRNILKGILATATMDFLSGSTYQMGLIAPLSPHLIGRWFASVARGQILLKDVAEVPPVAHELAIAVPMHYAIGITLALLYLSITLAFGLSPRSPLAALGSG